MRNYWFFCMRNFLVQNLTVFTGFETFGRQYFCFRKELSSPRSSPTITRDCVICQNRAGWSDGGIRRPRKGWCLNWFFTGGRGGWCMTGHCAGTTSNSDRIIDTQDIESLKALSHTIGCGQLAKFETWKVNSQIVQSIPGFV